VADLVFAFDAAIDRPVPAPEDAPPAVAEAISAAVAESLGAAAAVARRNRAAALVLVGRVLDPLRASPAQAAAVRTMIAGLAAENCRTVVVAEATTACHDLARMLGEPSGLSFVTPLAAFELDIRGIRVEIVSAHGPLAGGPIGGDAAFGDRPAAALHRRIVVGCDADDVSAAGFEAAAAAWAHPGTFWVWGTRRRQPLPSGVHALPPLQARSAEEPAAGSCATLALVDRSTEAADPRAVGSVSAPRADWRGSWQEIPTHAVVWRMISIESPAGGDEELATAIWAALEGIAPRGDAAVEIVRCAVACGTSVARRVRVGEIAAETLARVRQLYDPKSFRVWVREVFADPTESLAPLGHARSGGRPGTTTSFSSALADIVAALEQSPAAPIAAETAREAGWLALELVEST
jgi:hypothetical protein